MQSICAATEHLKIIYRMRKLLIILCIMATSAGCSKDDDKSLADSDCGAVISLDKTRADGGVKETISLVECGDEWDAYRNITFQSGIKINKGDSRPAATYLVATKSDTVYIRYEGGMVPQPTIDSFLNIGYTVNIATLTGLEHIKWP